MNKQKMEQAKRNQEWMLKMRTIKESFALKNLQKMEPPFVFSRSENFDTVTYNNRVIHGKGIQWSRPAGDGTGVVNTHQFFIPIWSRVRDRSKYMPHQGTRECARRRGELR